MAVVWTGFIYLGPGMMPMLWGIAALAMLGPSVNSLEAMAVMLTRILPVGVLGLVVLVPGFKITSNLEIVLLPTLAEEDRFAAESLAEELKAVTDQDFPLGIGIRLAPDVLSDH